MKNILILVLLSFGTNAFAQVFLEQVPLSDEELPFTKSYEMRHDSAFRIIINEYSVKKIPDGKIYQESGREEFLFKVKPGTSMSLDDIKVIDQYGSITKPLSHSAVRYGKWPVAFKRELVRTQETFTLNGTVLESRQSTVSEGVDNRVLGVEIFGALVLLGIPYAILLWMMSKQVFMLKLVGCFLITTGLLFLKQKELLDMVFFDICLMSLMTIIIMMTSTVLHATGEQIVEQIIPPEKPVEN